MKKKIMKLLKKIGSFIFLLYICNKFKNITIMTLKEKNEIIKALENEIKNQMPVVLDSIKCDTMSDEQLHYFVSGVEKGMKLCVDILKEERV